MTQPTEPTTEQLVLNRAHVILLEWRPQGLTDHEMNVFELGATCAYNAMNQLAAEQEAPPTPNP